jgi:hypothetical protein
MQGEFFFFQDTDEKILAHLCYLLAGPAEIQSLIWVNPQVTSSHTFSSLRVAFFLACSASQSNFASQWSGCLLSLRGALH